jgi:hypothetical protein
MELKGKRSRSSQKENKKKIKINRAKCRSGTA